MQARVIQENNLTRTK